MAEQKPLTGRKVLAIMVAAFAVIIAANLTMLFAATGSFPGLVVKNSYIASQEFDRKTAAQRALGWTAATEYEAGRLTVTMTGRDGEPVTGLAVVAVIGRPASDRDDVRLPLTEPAGARLGTYAAALDLAPGRWRIEILGTGANGAAYEAAAEFLVRDAG